MLQLFRLPRCELGALVLFSLDFCYTRGSQRSNACALTPYDGSPGAALPFSNILSQLVSGLRHRVKDSPGAHPSDRCSDVFLITCLWLYSWLSSCLVLCSIRTRFAWGNSSAHHTNQPDGRPTLPVCQTHELSLSLSPKYIYVLVSDWVICIFFLLLSLCPFCFIKRIWNIQLFGSFLSGKIWEQDIPSSSVFHILLTHSNVAKVYSGMNLLAG